MQILFYVFKKLTNYFLSPQKIKFAFISSSFVNFLIRILSYIRTAIIAYAFGLTIKMDVYNVAHSLIEITIFVLGNSFDVLGIPQLVKTMKEKGEFYFRKLSGSLFSFSIIITFIFLVITFSFSKYILKILAPGFDSEKKLLILKLLPYFLPLILTYIPYYALNAVLKSQKRFRLTLLSDFFLSLISLLLVALFHKKGFEIIPISLGISYIVGLLFEMLCIYKLKMMSFSLDIFSPQMKIIYHNMFSLSLLFLISQLYRVVDKGFASLLPVGSISALSYATLIVSTIVTTFTFTGIFLTGFSEKKDIEIFFKKSMAMNLFVALPISMFLFFNSSDILRILLKRGLFDERATLFTGSLLSIYSIILFASLGLGVIYAFYQSQNKFKIIIIFSAIGLSLNALLNYIFIKPFGAQGIITATVLSNYIVFIISLLVLTKKYLQREILLFTSKYFFLYSIITLPIAFLIYRFCSFFLFRAILYFTIIYFIFIYFDIPKILGMQQLAIKTINNLFKK